MNLSRIAFPSIALALSLFPAAFAGTFKHITIDGEFSDWAGVPIAYSDPSEEAASAGTDFQDVWIAHDDDYVYVRFSLYNNGDPLRAANNIFVNADGDASTGYSGHSVGSEMVVQGGTGYQEKNGGFNDGSTIQDLGWASAPAGATNQFEFRLSRKAKFEDGSSVFSGNSIGILLETESSSFAEVDVASDAGAIEYTMEAAPPAATGDRELVSLTGTPWKFNHSGTDPGSSWRDMAFDDTQAGWQSGSGLFGKTGTPFNYPGAINTTLNDVAGTYYFRTKFTWANDTAGLSLIASNFVSDGAIVYLNGAEVARVRMPEGAVTSATPATGAHPAAGQVEIIDLPANALAVGDNVLAVEVHQSANDASDLVFGLSLFASDRLPAAIASPSSPQTIAVDEGAGATLTVRARGAAPITYQWFKGSGAIPGATNASYTIGAVGPADAGEYLVKASNAYAQNVASPVFTIQPKAVAVQITNPNLPADLTVTEGSPASFDVNVDGSGPISYQWFKDGVALPGATNATYEIAVTLTNHAGLYASVVSNRISGPLTSRPARLTVSTDKEAPAVLSASGGGTYVLLQFSEPVDPASVSANGFALNPVVSVASAQLSADDASIVLLNTGALTYGTLYSVSTTGVKDRFGNSVTAATRQQFRASIMIDGDFSDWAGITPALSDPQDAGSETGSHGDFKDVWITSDNDYIYLHFTLWQPDDPFIFYNNIFVDTDNDPSTGYAFNGIGSDLLIQGGGGYQEEAGTFNAGAVDQLGWLAAPAAPATEFEARFSRKAVYANADAGGLVFQSPTIALVLESESTAFATVETAPDNGTGAITHDLRNFQPTDLGKITLAREGNGIHMSWSGAGALQESATLSPANWQNVSDGANPYTAPLTGKEHYYRLISP